nr:MAG TPA: protein of unknown function DUF859 [Caudoviricetes sp.]
MALSGSFHNYPTSQFGLYCEWTGSQSKTGNYTAVTLKVYLHIWSIYVGARNDGIASINGSSGTYSTPAISDDGGSWHFVHLFDRTVNVSHNSNGTKTGVPLSASWRFSGTYSGVSIGTITASTTVDLDTIDRSAPTVSVSASIVSTSSITVKGSASKSCNRWDYSLDGGSSWTNFSTSNGTSASKTLTGLTSKNYSSIKVRARRTDNEVWGTSGSASADITALNISFSASNITANSVYINAKSSVTANIWQYSIDNGSSWTQFSTTAGTSAVRTIKGLAPNTTYQIKVRARKQSNGLYGESAVSSVKTLGATVLNSVSTLTIDLPDPTLNINWTVYDKSYTHSLTIKNGSSNILTITGLTGSAGTNNKTISLTSSQRTAVLDAMSAVQSLSATYVLTTYGDSIQIGSDSSVTGTIQTTTSISKPTFTDFTYEDINTTTKTVTGNALLFVQSKSQLQVNCTAATAKNDADIVRYRATIGEKTVYSTTTVISFGAIPDSGSLSLTVAAIDSRGYETSVAKTITVIPYENITINSYQIRRENNAEDTIQLAFSGTLSSVTVSETAKNSFVRAQYRTKNVSSTSWSSYAAISGVESSASEFSFDNDAWITLPNSNAYNIQIEVSDKLSSSTVTLYINKGQPLVAFREKKVGINTNNPMSALDVNGNIMMNNFNVQGFVTVLSDTSLNYITPPGIYYAEWTGNETSTNDYPTNSSGILEVITAPSGFTVQRFTDSTATVYIRTKVSDTWSAWKLVTIT